MNWQTGPARCRSDEYEAEIVGKHGDYLVGVTWNKGRPNEWYTHRWDPNGTSLYSSSLDLIPPRLTLEEAARECAKAAGMQVYCLNELMTYTQHFIRLQAEGRV